MSRQRITSDGSYLSAAGKHLRPSLLLNCLMLLLLLLPRQPGTNKQTNKQGFVSSSSQNLKLHT